MEDEFLLSEPTAAYGAGPVYNIKHRAYLFAKDVVLFIGTQTINKLHYSIFDQLIRSATSIGANLVEGKSIRL